MACLTAALAAMLISGCTTKAKARQQAQQAYLSGQRQAAAVGVPKAPEGNVVRVLGNVAKHDIEWTEDLTVARALVEAHYQGQRDPWAIFIVRGGQRNPVNLRRLLNGSLDPVVQPGDIIEIMQ